MIFWVGPPCNFLFSYLHYTFYLYLSIYIYIYIYSSIKNFIKKKREVGLEEEIFLLVPWLTKTIMTLDTRSVNTDIWSVTLKTWHRSPPICSAGTGAPPAPAARQPPPRVLLVDARARRGCSPPVSCSSRSSVARTCVLVHTRTRMLHVHFLTLKAAWAWKCCTAARATCLETPLCFIQ